MHFGIQLDNQFVRTRDLGPDFAELIGMAEAAADLDFESVFCVHHYLASQSTPQPLLTLARLVPHTGNMKLGVAVYMATLEHPIQLAENSATLDQLSGGRLVLGLGAGYRRSEFAAFAIERATRWSRLAETVDLVKAMWRGEPVYHQGRHFSLDGEAISVLPRQVGGPPIWVGANAPATVLRAARIGDTWIAPPNVKVRWAIGNLQAFKDEAAAVNPSVISREHPIMRELYITDSPRDADRIVSDYVRPHYLELAQYDLNYFETMFDDLRAKAFLFGSAESVAADIADLQAAGFDHFIFRVRWPGMPVTESIETLRRFAAEVRPLLTAAVA